MVDDLAVDLVAWWDCGLVNWMVGQKGNGMVDSRDVDLVVELVDLMDFSLVVK